MSFMAKVVPNPRPFFDLQEQYKQCLMEESALNKAAKLAAEEDMPLNSNLPDGIKVAAVKPLTRQVRVWTKRVRHGGGGGVLPNSRPRSGQIGHFTVVCLVTFPVSESEAGGDLALIQTFLPFIC